MAHASSRRSHISSHSRPSHRSVSSCQNRQVLITGHLQERPREYQTPRDGFKRSRVLIVLIEIRIKAIGARLHAAC